GTSVAARAIKIKARLSPRRRRKFCKNDEIVLKFRCRQVFRLITAKTPVMAGILAAPLRRCDVPDIGKARRSGRLAPAA
ncbi:MAG: hypothetical protein WCZ65_11685, partial [Lysobacteraceae bacterium]